MCMRLCARVHSCAGAWCTDLECVRRTPVCKTWAGESVQVLVRAGAPRVVVFSRGRLTQENILESDRVKIVAIMLQSFFVPPLGLAIHWK